MRRSRHHLIACCVLLAGTQRLHAQAPEPPPRTYLHVAIPGHRGDTAVEPARMQRWAAWLGRRGYDVDCAIHVKTGTFGVFIEPLADRTPLHDAGFTILEEHPGVPLQTMRVDAAYFDPIEIKAHLDQVALDHPTITRVFSIGLSVEGRDIWAMEISDNPGVVEDEPAFQLNGQHHAREVATSHVVIDAIDTLTGGFAAGDPTITAWVQDYKIVCVPMVNPDGVNHVFTVNDNWRKNRRFNNPSFGVDLNRNYPYHWGTGTTACERSPFGGSSGTASSDAYRGPSTASEPETQAMIALADAWHFVMATSYHSFGQFIDYPYACNDGNPDNRMPEHAVVDAMMVGVRDAIASVDAVFYDVFSPVAIGPVNGDDTSWYYAHLGTYPFIIEVGTSFRPIFTSQLPGIIARNRAGWQWMLTRLGQARIDLHVINGCNQQPTDAQVTLLDFTFDTDELARSSFLPFGRWTWLVEPNQSYTVRVTKPGFVTSDVLVAVGNAPMPVDVTLQPSAPQAPGDWDCSGTVDLADLPGFVACLSGPGGGSTAVCDVFDFAPPDNDVDLVDYAVLMTLMVP